MRIEYHRTLIADSVRNEVIYGALKANIVAGETVVADIGAGTGLLGMMAARLGAKEVFLYEAAEVAGVAEAVIASSGYANCFVMPCHSTEMQEPPQVDLIVSETLGNYAFEEDIVTTLNDARRRFLKAGGVILPTAIAQFAAPVIAPRIDRELRVWARTGKTYDIDLSLPQLMSFNNVYVRRLAADEVLAGSAQEWDRVHFHDAADTARSGSLDWTFAQSARVYGVGVWWEAEFGKGLSLSTAPEAAATHWEQLYFPLEDSLDISPGDVLRFEIASQSTPDSGTHLSWAAELRSAAGVVTSRQEMDLDKGYLP